jgi:hypothetical protein
MQIELIEFSVVFVVCLFVSLHKKILGTITTLIVKWVALTGDILRSKQKRYCEHMQTISL